MEKDAKLNICDNLSFSFEGNQGVVLSLKDGWYITLNQTGIYIINQIQNNENITYKLLLANFASKFKLSEKQAKADLDEFLDELKKEGVIKYA
jgi:hypothetical protein